MLVIFKAWGSHSRELSGEESREGPWESDWAIAQFRGNLRLSQAPLGMGKT